jgi:23S rRNA (uracil1939-C5)-methyltransferase
MGRLEDGRPVFATGAFPGDQIQLETAEDRGSFVQARAYSLSEESPERVVPVCAYLERCGGCDWMWINETAQRRTKGSLIEQALERIGKLSSPETVEVHASPHALRYRARVRLQLKEGRVGFFSRGTHDIVEVDDCKVSTEELWNLVGQIRTLVGAAPQAFESVSHVEVRVFRGTLPQRERASVYFELEKSGQRRASVSRALQQATAALREHALVRFSSEGPVLQAFSPSAGAVVQAPVGGFTQVNEGVNQALVGRVLEEVKRAGARRFLDLYCGSGNFSLPLLHAGLAGVGVEASPEAIFAARKQVDNDGLSAEFYAEDCASYLARSAHAPGSFDVVIVDPPRAGAKDCTKGLLELQAPLLLMIACDPASLARDVGELTRSGYRLRKVEGFDMFPQTHHVETLAILELDESARLSRPAS